MKNRYSIFHLLIIVVLLTSCDDLGVQPNNIITNDDVYKSESGINAYMARLYSLLPVEDFKFSRRTGFHDWYQYRDAADDNGNAISRDANGVIPMTPYWGDGYHLIRQINSFLETIKNYSDNYSQGQINNWEGEAKFMRAFTYFAMVKRYGGVPLIKQVLQYPEKDRKQLQRERASSKNIYKFINKDLNNAINLLDEESQKGKVNKYTAYALKSRIFLFAGSIAEYNSVSLRDSSGSRIVGLPSDSVVSYFRKSFMAAGKLEGHYSLYKKEWQANDPDAQYLNFRDLFFSDSSPENIWVKYYSYPDSFHGFDAYNVPLQSRGPNGYGAGLCPTFNFVKLFSGLPRYSDGSLKLVDKNGDYVLYDNMYSFFEDAEPRLRATVILPGSKFKDEKITVRRGIYTGSANGGIEKLLPEDSRAQYPKNNLVVSANPNQSPYTLPNGKKMNPAGASGRFTAFGFQTPTGFYGRKYLVPDLPQSQVLEQHSDQHFILIRYAEMLLNRAETALELKKLGDGSANYTNTAFKALNKIRERAGAPKVKNPSEISLKMVREERRKEMAFERRYWWQLIRTRQADKKLDGTTFKILNPFYASEAGKYFYDQRYQENGATWTFQPKWYYEQIPGGVMNSNKKLIQNPGY